MESLLPAALGCQTPQAPHPELVPDPSLVDWKLCQFKMLLYWLTANTALNSVSKGIYKDTTRSNYHFPTSPALFWFISYSISYWIMPRMGENAKCAPCPTREPEIFKCGSDFQTPIFPCSIGFARMRDASSRNISGLLRGLQTPFPHLWVLIELWRVRGSSLSLEGSLRCKCENNVAMYQLPYSI